MTNHHDTDTVADADADAGLAALTSNGYVAGHVPYGTIIDHWQCPGCDRTINIVHRAGRPRLYCSHACRQRIYRWRRQHHTHTTHTPTWPTEAAYAQSHQPRKHALRNPTDPLAHRHDRRHREITVCGLLARPRRQPGTTTPFLPGGLSCRTCTALTQPRPHGLVPPNATPPPYHPHTNPDTTIEQLHLIHPDYPLRPQTRHLLTTIWQLPPPPQPHQPHRQAA